MLFYKNYEFFYNQYKHGLAVGMRPLGNLFNEAQIKEDKNGTFKPYLVVYDNLKINNAAQKGRINIKQGIMFPVFTENVRPFLTELEQSNNLLRFVFPPDFPNFSFDLLVDIAYKTYACMNVFLANYSRKINPSDEILEFQLPANYRENKVYLCKYMNTNS